MKQTKISPFTIFAQVLIKKIDTKELGNRPRGIRVRIWQILFSLLLSMQDKLLKLDENFEIIDASDTGKFHAGSRFLRREDLAYIASISGESYRNF